MTYLANIQDNLVVAKMPGTLSGIDESSISANNFWIEITEEQFLETMALGSYFSV